MSDLDTATLARFAFLLQREAPPLAVTLAYEALALFYRRCYREAIIVFWTALEMAISEAEIGVGGRTPDQLPKGTVEQRLLRLAESAGLVIPPFLSDGLAALRRFRNDLVHGVPGIWRYSWKPGSESRDLESLIPATFEILAGVMAWRKGKGGEPRGTV